MSIIDVSKHFEFILLTPKIENTNYRFWSVKYSFHKTKPILQIWICKRFANFVMWKMMNTHCWTNGDFEPINPHFLFFQIITKCCWKICEWFVGFFEFLNIECDFQIQSEQSRSHNCEEKESTKYSDYASLLLTQILKDKNQLFVFEWNQWLWLFGIVSESILCKQNKM